jgi:hypothetical protein
MHGVKAMACSIPTCVLIERIMPDGSETLLMATDLSSALTEAAQAHATGAWFANRVVMGRDAVLEGDALAEAISALAGSSGPADLTSSRSLEQIPT